MAQIRPVTSESLEAAVRRLLPSQQGFGEDLQAQNVIVPVIDITPAAEGTDVRSDLQTAFAFGSQTTFSVNNTTTTVASGAGFYRIAGVSNIAGDNTVLQNVIIAITDGFSTKNLLAFRKFTTSSSGVYVVNEFDHLVWLRPQDSLTVTATINANCTGSTRQIADANGELVNPSGFDPQ